MDARIRKYILAVMKHAYLKTEVRRRIAEDLKATMLAASENQPVEDVIRDMGSPLRMAKELMDVHATSVEEMGVINAVLYASMYGPKRTGIEIKSRAQIGNRPLIHIAAGYDEETGDMRVADGIIAIGNIAKGWIALGGVAIGYLAFGGVTIGGIALGGLSVGLLGFGGLALALVLAMGGLAVAGGMSVGGVAIAGWTAIGGYAQAMHYYGENGQNFSLPGWAAWLIDNGDTLGLLVPLLIMGPVLYLTGIVVSKALGLDIRDILE